jgi:hypothetical protein
VARKPSNSKATSVLLRVAEPFSSTLGRIAERIWRI